MGEGGGGYGVYRVIAAQQVVRRSVSGQTAARGRTGSAGVAVGIVGSLVLLGAVAPSRGAEDQRLFGDKPIRMIVGMPPGGGVDAYARLVQRHMPSHLADTPNVIVENAPGAGSLRAVMMAANSWRDPATSVVTFSSSLILDAVASPDRVKIDLRDFAFLGNVAEDSRVCFVRADSGVQTMQDLEKHSPMNFGATAPGTSGNVDTAMLKALFHVRMHEVQGYPGSAEKRLALDRGEIDGDCAGVTSLPESWLKSGKINALIRFSPTPSQLLPASTPFGGDLIGDAERRRLYDFLVTPQEFGRLFMVSRKIAPARVEALRKALEDTMRDPAFVAEAQSLGLLVTPTPGEEIDRRIAALYQTPTPLLAEAKTIIGP